MKDINIRAFRPDDLAGIKQLTVEAFAGVTLEQNVETALGVLHGRDWRWRKARHIDEDVAANRAGIFVAEAQGRIAGYITTRVDRESSKGRIPNLAVRRSSAARVWDAGSSSTRWIISAAKVWPTHDRNDGAKRSRPASVSGVRLCGSRAASSLCEKALTVNP